MSFADYQKLRLAGLTFAASQSSRNDKPRLEKLIQYTTEATNIPELGAVTSLSTPNRHLGFMPIVPIKNQKAKDVVGMKFGSEASPIDWYFMYAQFQDDKSTLTFSISIIKQLDRRIRICFLDV